MAAEQLDTLLAEIVAEHPVIIPSTTLPDALEKGRIAITEHRRLMRDSDYLAWLHMSPEEKAQAAATGAQAAIGEAYQSPHTRTVALEAARIALGIKTTQSESQSQSQGEQS